MTHTTHFKGQCVHLEKELLQINESAKPFTLVANDLSDVSLNDYAGKRKILNIFPSIDTGICAAAARKFNELASKMQNIVILCISADLPFAQSRFCGSEGLNNVIMLSTFRHHQFAQEYGLAIADGPLKGLMARAVILLNTDNIVKYIQLVDEITEEPNYNAILQNLNDIK